VGGALVASGGSERGALPWLTAVLVAALIVGVLVLHGANAEGATSLVRATARLSLVLFAAAFASWGLAPSSWPARRRDGLLAALAVSHGTHALAVAALAVLTGAANLMERAAPITLAGGALAYAVIGMGALRPRSRFVVLGLFWVWIVFMVAYVPRALASPARFAPAVVLLLAGLALRTREWRRERAGAVEPTPPLPARRL
jgi:hypothetical protein